MSASVLRRGTRITGDLCVRRRAGSGDRPLVRQGAADSENGRGGCVRPHSDQADRGISSRIASAFLARALIRNLSMFVRRQITGSPALKCEGGQDPDRRDGAGRHHEHVRATAGRAAGRASSRSATPAHIVDHRARSIARRPANHDRRRDVAGEESRSKIPPARRRWASADSWQWFTETGRSRAPAWKNEVTLRSVERCPNRPRQLRRLHQSHPALDRGRAGDRLPWPMRRLRPTNAPWSPSNS